MSMRLNDGRVLGGRFYAAALLILLNLSCSGPPAAVSSHAGAPKNVILFISDGAGPAQFTLGRDYLIATEGREHLHLDEFQTGSVSTASADSRVTDSAAGATAYAAGIKTYNGAISVDMQKRPVRTILEAAEARRMATGLVATSRITHATPACFAAHVPDREMEAEIAVQELDHDIEVLFGGGADFFLPMSAGGSRDDGRDLLAEARQDGYMVARSLSEFRRLDRVPALALLAEDHLAYEIDRDTLQEPSLAELTRKAIDLLDRTGQGFFLLVEGSRIDHASHVNDPVGTVHDVIAYDDAFQEAVEFARRNGETLVVAVSDHETGGLSLGRSVPPPAFTRKIDAPTFWRSFETQDDYVWNPEALARAKRTTETIAQRLRQGDERSVMRNLAGVDDLTAEELTALREARETGDLVRVIGEVISRRARVGWTTGGHTAVDVNLYVLGPGGGTLHGNLENENVGRTLMHLLEPR